MKSKAFFLTLLSVLCICSMAFAQAPATQEEITLTTYYPAPLGDYDVLTANQLGIGTRTPAANTAVDITPVGTATMNNDVLTAVHINPTFIDAGFIGVQHNGLIVENGDVGIGTTAPDDRLHVSAGNVRITDEDGDTLIMGEEGGALGRFSFRYHGSSAADNQEFRFFGGDGSNDWEMDNFSIQAEDSYFSGNVGIGTTTPAESLEVNGAIRIANTANTNAGSIKWTGTDFEGCDGATWSPLGGISIRGWVNFDGTGGNGAKAFSGYNVASVVKNGNGDYTITWTNAFASNNYCLSGLASGGLAGPGPGANSTYVAINSLTATSARIVTRRAGVLSNPSLITVMAVE